MYKYIRIKNNKISENIISDIKLKDTSLILVENACKVGEPITWYEKNYSRIDDEQLVNDGLRKDNRGIYYNIYTKAVKEVTELDKDFPPDSTKLKPGIYDKWDKESKTWKLDLSDIQGKRHSQITTEREKRILSGFSYEGYEIQADSGSQAIAHQYLTKYLAGISIFPLVWRTKDNHYLTINNLEEFTDFTDAMTAHVNGQFQQSWTAKDDIDHASSIEEVETIFNNYLGE